MTYRPDEFWEKRLREQFDLRGTGETGLSLAYNQACYALRGEVLERALHDAQVVVGGKQVLDVGCGTGFFTQFYLDHGADVTGIDIAHASIERLSKRYPAARFELADVGESPIEKRYGVVNVFDVLFHITDDSRWEFALRNLAGAVEPGGVLAYTDVFRPPAGEQEHNRTRSLVRHLGILGACGLTLRILRPTHVLLNRELGAFRFLNRFPGLLLGVDRSILTLGLGRVTGSNQLLVARREAP